MTRDDQEYLTAGSIAGLINDASIDRIVAIDTGQNIISWNNSCAQLTGIGKEEAMGKGFFEIFSDSTGNQNIIKAIAGALKGYRMFVPSDEGSCLGNYHESHFIPLRNADDAIVGVLCLMHDVAHRVKTEQELKSLNRSLVRKNKELKDKNAELMSFSQVTSHDLKEPLRKIYTFIEMILSADFQILSATSKAHFKRVQAAVQRMGMLTDDLSNFAQLDMNTEEIAVLNLNHILKAVQNNIQESKDGDNATIEFTALPVIKGYKPLLADMFRRIIGNSIKFQKNGTTAHIVITAKKVNGTTINHADAATDKDYWKITFTDNGIGFEPKYAERIFLMFQRLNKDAYPGSGIGLTVCRKIMHLHNGFISAESVPGAGCSFHCFFPAQ